MANNLVVRQLGPITSALRDFQQSLYQTPRTVIAGIDETLWPNPLQPVTPMGPPRAEPLGWPLNWGRNIIFTPREDAEYSAAQLRGLSRYILARICIENNKDMLTRMPWRMQLRPLPGETSKEHAMRNKNDPNIKKLSDFFARPNRDENWDEFWRPVLEDMLVIDAASIFLGRDKSGKIVELRWVEGASITRLVDKHGWTPPPPSPAYQQLWQGYPRIDLTTDQLLYRPRNISPRNTQASYLYGYSPTEQMAQEIQIGIERLRFVLDFYAEGTLPGGMLFVPRDVPPDKIKEAQLWIDSNLAGNLAARRRLQLYQGFQQEGKSEQVVFPKEPNLADTFDDVHIRKICFGYGTSAQRLMRSMNRASAEMQQEAAEEEGMLPYLRWLKGTIDILVQVKMGLTEYEIVFDHTHEADILKQKQADDIDVKIGLYTRNEIRRRHGDDPRPEKEADELSVVTSTGVIPLHMAADIVIAATTGQGASNKPGSAASSGGNKPSIKTNGVSGIGTCSVHKNTYPRTNCRECVEVEFNRIQQIHQEVRNG